MKFAERHYNLLKWCILLFAYGFLIFRLATFDQYSVLVEQWSEASAQHLVWLLPTLALLPVNLWLESVKWRIVVSDVERLTPATAFKSVLSGITIGFFTPNRLGDFAGRIVFLKKENRLTASALSFVGTLAQNLAIMVGGLPAALLFFALHEQIETLPTQSLTLFFGITALIIIGIYSFLPQIAKPLLKRCKTHAKLNDILLNISLFGNKKLLNIFLISFVRYAVFSTQFYFVLRFFGVDLSLWQAIIGIATNYLFVTFTPTVALAEVAIRGSYAMIFIGAFTENLVGVAAAGIVIWLINYCLPLLVGSVFFSKSKWQ